MTIAATMVVLFCIATTVAITVRWFRVPYTVGLVLAGLAVGALHVLSPPVLTKELLFDAFLPGLLFEAAFNTDVRELRRVALTVTVLAVPGVVASIVLSGLGAWLLVHILTPSQHLDLSTPRVRRARRRDRPDRGRRSLQITQDAGSSYGDHRGRESPERRHVHRTALASAVRSLRAAP